MALIDFQTALGRLLCDQKSKNPISTIRLESRERHYVEALRKTAGFRFCASVQRSWCIGRAARAAQLTLSLLPHDERQKLLEQWVDSGAGRQSFYEVEAESFLEFISEHLRDPSHELTVCQFEQGALRASTGARDFVTPDLSLLTNPDCVARRGTYSSLVRFYAEPSRLLESLQNRRPLPPMLSQALTVMFSPGLEQLWREPSAEEIQLWEALRSPCSVKALLANSHAARGLAEMLKCGAIECAADAEEVAGRDARPRDRFAEADSVANAVSLNS